MNYVDAFQDVISQLPKVPEFIITASFNRTVRRFCEMSTVYRHTDNTIDVVANQQQYTVTIPANTMVNEVHTVLYKNAQNYERLQPATFKWLTNELDTQVYQADTPRFYVHTTGNAITIWAKPIDSVTDGLNVEVSLKPTRTATSIDDVIADRYIEGIVAGVVAEICRVPDTEFHNKSLFPTMEAYFNAAVEEAKKDATGSDANVPRKVKYGGIQNTRRRRKYGGYY